MGDKLTLLKRALSQDEAFVIKSVLESHNIQVHLMDNDDVLFFVGFSGIRIMILESDLEKASLLLETTTLTVDEE